MPVDQQPYQPITMPMAVALEGLEQLAHLGLGEMLADAIGLVRLAPRRGNWSHYNAFHTIETS